jgi:hypothetical protein
MATANSYTLISKSKTVTCICCGRKKIYYKKQRNGSSDSGVDAMGKMMVGIGFYRREQWSLLLASAVDSHILEKTYDDWLDVVDASIDKIKAHGVEPKLVDVDIEELILFCRKEGLQNDAGARSKFVAKMFSEQMNA